MKRFERSNGLDTALYKKTTLYLYLMPVSGMVEMSSFWVNTDLKCWLSMLALVRLSDLMNPSLSCSCCIPDWSFL